MLFSATQTTKVADLARISLRPGPLYIDVDKAEQTSTVDTLSQGYVVCPSDRRFLLLFTFLKKHLKKKIVVFFSSCNSVKYHGELLNYIDVPVLDLHGKQKQTARLTMFQRFTTMKHAVLLATDVAARGLDFPAVDWVVQVDAPEDAETYIHRVGRTARYESAGKGLLLLLPSEEDGMAAALRKKHVEIQKIKIKASKTQEIANQLQKLAFQDPEIKYLAQRVSLSNSYCPCLH